MSTKGTKNQKKSPSSEVVALTTLAPGRAQHLIKPRVGFEDWVEKLAGIAKAFPGAIATDGVDVELMRTSLASYQALSTPRDEAATKLGLIDDSRLVHSSATWDQMLTIYRRAKASTSKNPELAKALYDFEKWMKTGPKKKKAAATTPPTT